VDCCSWHNLTCEAALVLPRDVEYICICQLLLDTLHASCSCDHVTWCERQYVRLISLACAGLLAIIAAAGAEGDIAAAGDTKLGQLWKMRMFDDSESTLSPFVEPFLMYHQVCTCR